MLNDGMLIYFQQCPECDEYTILGMNEETTEMQRYCSLCGAKLANKKTKKHRTGEKER